MDPLRLRLRPLVHVPRAGLCAPAAGARGGGGVLPLPAPGALRCGARPAAGGPPVAAGAAGGGRAGGERPPGQLPPVSALLPAGVRLRDDAPGAGGHPLADAGAHRRGPPRGHARGQGPEASRGCGGSGAGLRQRGGPRHRQIRLPARGAGALPPLPLHGSVVPPAAHGGHRLRGRQPLGVGSGAGLPVGGEPGAHLRRLPGQAGAGPRRPGDHPHLHPGGGL